MGFYADQVVPRLVNKVMANKEFEPIRERVAAGLDGEVVEVGFGSGLNVPHYPPGVRRVRAVDPATLGRKLAAGRLAAAPVPVEFVGSCGPAARFISWNTACTRTLRWPAGRTGSPRCSG